MWARTKDTINRWKNSAKKGTRRSKRLCDQLRYYRRRCERLQARNKQLEQLCAPRRLARHHYPVQMIALAVFIVVQGGSLRCAAATAGFLATMMGWKDYDAPAHTCVRNWVLRCGLHIMRTSRDLSGQMVLILDESIQIGAEKLLLLLGIPLRGESSIYAPLCIQDVQILAMEVQPSWNSQYIQDFVLRFQQLHPKLQISYLISDCGSSILAAVRALQIPWVSDCTHVMMNAVKAIFRNDAALSRLCATLGQLRSKALLTRLGLLLPPTLRDKDRFLRIFTVIDWTQRMDALWDKFPDQLRHALAFYRRDRPLLNRLTQVRDLVDITATILKKAGMSANSYQHWIARVAQYKLMQPSWTRAANSFVKTMEAYFAQHQAFFEQQQRIFCCSDIIESIFGRYKNKGGMKAISADVLTIPLYNQTITIQWVEQALANVSEAMVNDWQNEYVCHNFLGRRRELEYELKSSG